MKKLKDKLNATSIASLEAMAEHILVALDDPSCLDNMYTIHYVKPRNNHNCFDSVTQDIRAQSQESALFKFYFLQKTEKASWVIDIDESSIH